jgi:hypothetical protein
MRYRGPVIWTAFVLSAGCFLLVEPLSSKSALWKQASVKYDGSAPTGKTWKGPQAFLHLELGYIEDIIVPRGSKLSVKVEDAVGKTIGEREAKTELDSPPYVMDIPLKTSTNLPLTVHASLVSVLGHEFSQTRQIDGAEIARADSVAIDMR